MTSESKDWEDRRELFLQRLEHLSREHGVAIGGCGCCGSPFLEDIEAEDRVGSEFGYKTEGADCEVNWRQVRDGSD